MPRDSESDSWRCTVCGRIGAVGRCCGEDTRVPVRAAGASSLGCNADCQQGRLPCRCTGIASRIKSSVVATAPDWVSDELPGDGQYRRLGAAFLLVVATVMVALCAALVIWATSTEVWYSLAAVFAAET